MGASLTFNYVGIALLGRQIRLGVFICSVCNRFPLLFSHNFKVLYDVVESEQFRLTLLDDVNLRVARMADEFIVACIDTSNCIGL